MVAEIAGEHESEWAAMGRVAELLGVGNAESDNPQLQPLLDLHEKQRLPRPRPRFRLLADKAYSHPSSRKQLRHRRVPRTIPERKNQKERRKAKGSAGGRPPAFDPKIYAQRNTVERGFLRLKQWRGIATRYDKNASTYLGGITRAATFIHLQTN